MTRSEGRQRQQGVSLIEVLVAMLVVSLGVLAMAGLLTTASRYGKTSEYRAMATLLASDIADRIRANKAALVTNGNAYNVTSSYEDWSDEPADSDECSEADCSAENLAARDIAEWSRSVFGSLPGGAGYVSVTEVSAGGTTRNFSADVWIAWVDPEAADGEAVADNECPDDFEVGDDAVQPRCAFFRIGL